MEKGHVVEPEVERCLFCAQPKSELRGPLEWRPGWLPHVRMHAGCYTEIARGGLD